MSTRLQSETIVSEFRCMGRALPVDGGEVDGYSAHYRDAEWQTLRDELVGGANLDGSAEGFARHLRVIDAMYAIERRYASAVA